MITSKSLAATAGLVDPAWNVSKAKFLGAGVNFFYIGAQETASGGVFFKPDGTKMYVAGSTSDSVFEYNLSTAWNISTAVLLQSKYIQPQSEDCKGVFFKPDGLKMYVVGPYLDRVTEYDLSTAWSVITAVFVRNFSVSAQELAPNSLFFKPDGTKMYVVGTDGDDVNEYDLSTAWNISTAVYLQTFSVLTLARNPTGVSFKPDGLKMYVISQDFRVVNEYDLSTAWNISTAVYLRQFSVASQDIVPVGLFFKDDGLVMYVVGAVSRMIYQYQLSTAWDISTSTYSMPTTKYLSLASAPQRSAQDLFFSPDGLNMYIMGADPQRVQQYTLSTAWAVSTASYTRFIGAATGAAGLFFKPDGTKMYVLDNFSSNDNVNEYTLSTAWDISTAVFVQLFYVGAQSTFPTSVFFKSDGLKMYVLGRDPTCVVHEYNLSTAWNVSTSVFLQSFSVAAQETGAAGLFFKPDGTKMYVVGTTGDDVNEYALSTPWNITTSSFVRLFSFAGQTTDPTGIFFRDTGLQMYITTPSQLSTNDAVWEYDLV